MRCPTLVELPVPPHGCHGWPWDLQSGPVPNLQNDGRPWPKISIVTPSYNQGRYIEETIRSILLQGYPDLEYFIMDGGSTDETVEIIRKYEPWLAGWVSEKDKGQSDAINKGFARCTGEIFNWVCSDDILARDALMRVAHGFCDPSGHDVIAGACLLQHDLNPKKNRTMPADAECWRGAPFSGAIWQPACFFRRSLIRRPRLLLNDLHYCMDRELWIYLWSAGSRWSFTDESLAVFRFTGTNKTTEGGDKTIKEMTAIYQSYHSEWIPLPKLLLCIWLPLVEIAMSRRSFLLRMPAHLVSRFATLVLRTFYPSKRVRALQRDFYHYRVGIFS